MTTGSKGLHVVIPIQPKHDFDQIRTFSREKAQTAVAPYSLRAIKNAPVATPLDWS